MRLGSRPRRRGTPAPLVRPFAIGLIGLAAIFAITYAAFAGRVPFSHPYQLHAIFSNSSQLRSGSPVRIAGIDVGEVSSVSAGPGSTADVTMRIDSGALPIHSDATFTIRPRVFLEGGFYVDLEPGSPNAPDLGGGATVPVAQTAVPVQFDQILSRLQLPVRQGLRRIIAQANSALASGGAAGLRRTVAELPPTLRDVAIVAEAAQGTRYGDIGRTIRAADTVTAQLASRDAELGDLVSSLDRTSAALVAEPGALGAGIRELDRFLGAAPAALTSLDRVVGPINRFIVELRPTARIAPSILRRLHQLNAALRGIQSPAAEAGLLSGLRPLLRNTPRFSLLARGLFPLAGPIVTCLKDNVMPTLRSSVDDGPLSSGRPVWQDFLHATVGLASAAQNFDANGPWFRYLGAIGPGTISTGSVPGLGQLFGSAPQPIIGSRPVWLGPGHAPPPLRPDAPCTKQAPPNLAANTGPAPASADATPASHLATPALRRFLLNPPVQATKPGKGG